jgi:DNA-binding transcriptional MerR regulator
LDKAPDAFRTISEVADEIDIPQHVLRFWESRFAQIKPMKRGGGRRYYRPDDVDLLRGVRHLLYGEGYTIRGVQRILRDEGAAFVQNVWRAGAIVPPPDSEDDSAEDDVAAETSVEARNEPDLSVFGRGPSKVGESAPQPRSNERREPTLSVPVPARPTGAATEGKLRAALEELISCRRLIDAALSDAEPADHVRSAEI